MEVVFKSIGVIHTPFKTAENMPIQGALRYDIKGEIELYPEFVKGLKDVEGFSHLITVYYFNLVNDYSLTSCPFLDDSPRGIFSIRGPRRPNPVGITIVKNLKIDDNIIKIAGIDMVDNTPLLDIKPYFPKVDSFPEATTGWMKDKLSKFGRKIKSDRRFIDE